MSKYVIYALMVTFSVTATNWVRMFNRSGLGSAATGTTAASTGSSWSSRTGGGGGSYGSGSSGGSSYNSGSSGGGRHK